LGWMGRCCMMEAKIEMSVRIAYLPGVIKFAVPFGENGPENGLYKTFLC
jgi:hypothetical protein